MVCYCPIRKIIYIHIPKTGGLTIEYILTRYYDFLYFTFDGKDKYKFLSDNNCRGVFKYILNNSDQAKIYDLNSFFKFSFVRNPYSRALSCINFLSKILKEKGNKLPSSFDDFKEISKKNHYFNVHFNVSQYEHLLDLDDKFTFNFIGKFENYKDDLNTILCEILGFKKFKEIHLNKSDKNMIYDKESLFSYIRVIHKDDFDRFCYSEVEIDTSLFTDIHQKDHN